MASKQAVASPSGSSASSAMAQAAAFYAVSTERSLETPQQNYVAGSTLQFNLPPSGIGTFAVVTLQGTVNVTSTATASQPTASPWYPYNLLTVSYVDYLGFTRCNASGWQLHLLEKIKAFQFDPSASLMPGVSAALQATIYAATVPTAAATSNVTGAVAFSFVIPISIARNSIRGSHLFNITGAQDIVSITCIAPTGGPNKSDSPLTVPTAAQTSVSLTATTVDLCYYYQDWPAGTTIPVSELQLAHQVNSVTQNQNIATGQQYQYLVPTGFLFYRFITEFNNNGAPDTVDITNFSFFLDANTPIHSENLRSYVARSQRLYGSPMPDGVLVTDCSQRPINSNSYSQVAINFTLDNTISLTSPFVRTLADALTLQNQNLAALGAQT